MVEIWRFIVMECRAPSHGNTWLCQPATVRTMQKSTIKGWLTIVLFSAFRALFSQQFDNFVWRPVMIWFQCVRLRNPHTCPFNGQRNDSCNCVSELGTVSGRTMFKRVRIDPATLYIIGKHNVRFIHTLDLIFKSKFGNYIYSGGNVSEGKRNLFMNFNYTFSRTLHAVMYIIYI